MQVKVSKGARFAGGDDSVCAAYDGKTEGVELVYQLKISNPDINVSAVRPSIFVQRLPRLDERRGQEDGAGGLRSPLWAALSEGSCLKGPKIIQSSDKGFLRGSGSRGGQQEDSAPHVKTRNVPERQKKNPGHLIDVDSKHRNCRQRREPPQHAR